MKQHQGPRHEETRFGSEIDCQSYYCPQRLNLHLKDSTMFKPELLEVVISGCLTFDDWMSITILWLA